MGNTQTAVNVLIHPSQFPEAVEVAMCESLCTRQMNHKFHYDTAKQTVKWLRLHEALSPARTDPHCLQIYADAFVACAEALKGATEIEVVSLGCGGGQKDAQLIRILQAASPGVRLRYVAVDVSVGLTLTAREAVIDAGVPATDVTAMAIDLGSTTDWSVALAPALSIARHRIVCFFGMLPNFIPATVLPQLSSLLRQNDFLLVSANLAPGDDYAEGVKRVLPLYDNELTRDWLWSVLLDLGIEKSDGEMKFAIGNSAQGEGLLRIEANVVFSRPSRIDYSETTFHFKAGESFGLFYSYRHTPIRVKELFASHGVAVGMHWTNGSGEEGVFLARK